MTETEHGFITTADGADVYFQANSGINEAFGIDASSGVAEISVRMKTLSSEKLAQNTHCSHFRDSSLGGVAIISVGNALREGKAGLAATFCESLPETRKLDVCLFDLALTSGALADCLRGHKAALIIDTTNNGTAPGTISMADLSTSLKQSGPTSITSEHGSFLADELRLASKQNCPPVRIVFFGVELKKIAQMSPDSIADAQLPELIGKLTPLVTKIVEALQKDA